jgi:farnesyl diphosphate synthase
MSSSSTTIPAVISGVAILQLFTSGAMDSVAEGFFAQTLLSQMALLALLFAVVFLAVEISHFIDASPIHDTKKKDKVSVSTLAAPAVAYPLNQLDQCANDKEKFLAIYPMLRKELLTHMTTNEMPAEAIEWCQKMMDYTVPGGKLNRGLTVIAVHRTLVQASKQRDLTSEEIAKASVLGWAIEFLQAFFLVADDVMDASKTRRNQPCWYMLDHVKNIAINDSFLLESYVFTMIRFHFGKEDYYLQLVELFLQVVQQTEFGQLLDLTSQDEASGEVDLTRFSLDRYKTIVKYKTAFYTFYLPVAIGMITSGVKDAEAFDLAKTICCEMGEYFQVQDDYLDCFGDPEVIGKGTNIMFEFAE